MTEAEHYQQTLDQRQQAEDEMTERVRDAMLRLPFNLKVGLIGEAEGNQFVIVDFGLRHFKVTIEEI